MLILAIDTATTVATTAVVHADQIICEHSRSVTTHSEGLLSMVDESLRDAGATLSDLDAIVCGEGPGSFTGLRIGMATAKGLCLAAGKPLLCVGSMHALALAAREQGERADVATILDARRSEVYCALWRAGVAVLEPVVCRPEDVVGRVGAGEVLLVGDGALRYAQVLLQTMQRARLATNPEAHRIRAGYLAIAARPLLRERRYADLGGAAPVYLRAPDIRPPKPR